MFAAVNDEFVDRMNSNYNPNNSMMYLQPDDLVKIANVMLD